MSEASIVIEEMSCMHCVGRVKKAVEGIAGITRLDVEIGKATVVFDEAKTSQKEIEAAITKAGYKVKA